MIQSHLNELRSVVEQATDLPEETRAKLLELTTELERDVQEGTVTPTATSSSDTADSSDTSSGSSGRLVSAIEGLEASHPEVTATVNNVATLLSKLGF